MPKCSATPHRAQRRVDADTPKEGGPLRGLDEAVGDAPAEANLLHLWERAQRELLRCCRHTLYRLRRGDGGFYEADDFIQDWFLEFAALVRRCHNAPECELWAAWHRMLWGGGLRVLRRAPQRLWSRREWLVEPNALALADAGDAPTLADEVRLPVGALSALTQREDAQRTQTRLNALDELEAALWALTPGQRLVLYLGALEGLPAADLARCLGLPNTNRVYARLFSARAALRRALQRVRADAVRRP